MEEIDAAVSAGEMEMDEVQLNIAEGEDKIEGLREQFIQTEYNVAKYIHALNKRVSKLFICFDPKIRDKEVTNAKGITSIENNIIINVYKDKETKTMKLEPRKVFTEKDCELVAGKPFNADTEQDTYEELMTLYDKEFDFCIIVNQFPNNIKETDWKNLEFDYTIDKEKLRKIGMEEEHTKIYEIIRRFEKVDIDNIIIKRKFPKDFSVVADWDEEKKYFFSNRYGHKLCELDDLFKYELESKMRNDFYVTLPTKVKTKEDKYQAWLLHLNEQEIMDGTNDLIKNGIIYEDTIFDESVLTNRDYKIYFYNKKRIPIENIDNIEAKLWFDTLTLDTPMEEMSLEVPENIQQIIDNTPNMDELTDK